MLAVLTVPLDLVFMHVCSYAADSVNTLCSLHHIQSFVHTLVVYTGKIIMLGGGGILPRGSFDTLTL